MMKQLMILSCILVFALLFTDCEKEEAPKAVDLTSLAQEFVKSLIKEDYSGAVEFFDNTMKGVMPADKVREAWQSLIAKVGPHEKIVGLRQTREQGYDIVFVTTKFGQATVDIKVVFNNAKQVSGLWFLPK